MPTRKQLPPALAEADRWIVWRYEDVGRPKPAKIPRRAEDLEPADSTEPEDRASFDQAVFALEAEESLSGVGFVLGDGFAGVDLDDCRDPETGEVVSWAAEIVQALGSYTEVSPSGTGLKVFLRGIKPGPRCRTSVGNGEVEIYDGDRYFTVTGQHLEGTPFEVAERSIVLEGLYHRLFQPVEKGSTDGPDDDLPAARLSDEELLTKARNGANKGKFKRLFDEGSTEGYRSGSEADAGLCALLAFWVGPDRDRIDRLFRASARMRDKWEREDYRKRTLDHALKNLRTKYDPGDDPDDFVSYLPAHNYIHRPTRRHWPAGSVNARVSAIAVEGRDKPVPASQWLDRHRAVHDMTWAPGLEEIIRDRITAGGGWRKAPGMNTYNLYQAPHLPEGGDAAKATRWVEHVHRLYPGRAAHIIQWLAHRVQRPGEKLNHALVLGGAQGIGKDTILTPVKVAIGERNVHGVSPVNFLDGFNPWLRSVLLVVDEARDLGDVNRYALYERTKTIVAAPPDWLTVNEKHTQQYDVPNVVGVCFTTNHRDGLYLPSDDRRHFVAWSQLVKEDFDREYFQALHAWYYEGGSLHVAAYLSEPERLEGFSPKAVPPRTSAWQAMVGADLTTEDDLLVATLDAMSRPDVLHLEDLRNLAPQQLADWLNDRKNARRLPHRLEEAGYRRVDNPADKQGRWRLNGTRTRGLYARIEMHRERTAVDAVERYCDVYKEEGF